MGNSVKYFAQVQVDDVSCSSLTHQCYIIECYQICQAQSVLSEPLLAVTYHLLIFHGP